MKRLGLTLLLFSWVVMADSDVIPLSKPNSGSTPGKNAASAAGLKGGPNAALKPYIKSIEIYGSTRLTPALLRETLGKDLDTWLQKGLSNDPSATEWEFKLRDKLKAKFGFPYAEWSVVQFFQPDDYALYVTLDIVETNDVARRMPFQPAPTGTFADPDGLISQWEEYEKTALDLVQKQEVEPDTEQCPAFHCPFGHKHPKLKKYEKIFVEGVKKNEKKLVAIETGDKRPEFRGAACYLLAYLKDGNKVVKYDLDRIKDPQELVRNNCLRVLGDIAELHPEYIIPVNVILPALHYPKVSDRSKALYVVFQLASNLSAAREQIRKTAVSDLLSLLESKQPDNRDLSEAILRKISGKDFPATDLAAWKDWFSKSADRAITQK